MVTFERTHFQYLALVGLVGVYFLYRGVSAPGYTEEASFDLRMKGTVETSLTFFDFLSQE